MQEILYVVVGGIEECVVGGVVVGGLVVGGLVVGGLVVGGLVVGGCVVVPLVDGLIVEVEVSVK